MEDIKKRFILPTLHENLNIIRAKKKAIKLKLEAERSISPLKKTRAVPEIVEGSSKKNKQSITMEVEEDGDEEVEVEIEGERIEVHGLDSEHIDLLRKRADTVRKHCIPPEKFPTVIVNETFNADIIEVFNAIYSESEPVDATGKRRLPPWDSIRKQVGDTETKATKFDPPAPKFYAAGDKSSVAVKELVNFPS